MPRPWYRVRVQVGSRTWDVKSTDAPAPGPILPLSFGWAVPDGSLGFPAQPDPATASLAIAAPTPDDIAGVDIGSPVAVSVWLQDAGDPVPVASFAGRVAEMRARPDLAHGTVYQITALDYTVDLSGSLVGGTDWPAETTEARSDRILADAGITPPAGLAPDPGGNVAARPAAAVSARDLLLETLAHGVTADKARWIVTSDVNQESGSLDVVPYSYRPVRRAVYAIDILDPCVIDVGVEWVRSRRSAADWITIDHPGGPTVYGNPTGVPLPPLKTEQTDPATLADYLLDNVSGNMWDGGSLRLHVHRPEAAAFWGMVAGWFDYGLGRAVVIPDIPAPQAPGGTTRYSGMVAAARFTIPTDARPVVDIRLRADIPNDSYQVTRWSDVPPAETWANMTQTTTWADYDPGSTAGGVGTLTTRWDDVPPAETWETYDPSLTWFDHRTIPKP